MTLNALWLVSERWFCHTDTDLLQDRRQISEVDLVEPVELLHENVSWADDDLGMDDQVTTSEPSAKIDQLLKLLTLLPRGEKSLVFSSFTSFLNIVAKRLQAEG